MESGVSEMTVEGGRESDGLERDARSAPNLAPPATAAIPAAAAVAAAVAIPAAAAIPAPAPQPALKLKPPPPHTTPEPSARLIERWARAGWPDSVVRHWRDCIKPNLGDSHAGRTPVKVRSRPPPLGFLVRLIALNSDPFPPLPSLPQREFFFTGMRVYTPSALTRRDAGLAGLPRLYAVVHPHRLYPEEMKTQPLQCLHCNGYRTEFHGFDDFEVFTIYGVEGVYPGVSSR